MVKADEYGWKINCSLLLSKGAKIPRSGVQNAQDIFYANTVIDMYAEEIDYVYMIGQDGKHYFANCIENPDDDCV